MFESEKKVGRNPKMPGGKAEAERPAAANNVKSNLNNRPAEAKEVKKEVHTPHPHPPQQHGGGGGGKRPFKRGGGAGSNNQSFHGGYHQSPSGSEFSNYNRQRMQGGNHNFSIPGPTTNLETKPQVEAKKFTGRCRLFVGNITPDIDEKEFRSLFEPFGELSEVFLNAQKGFGFVKMDTRANAETARLQLDGMQRKGRVLRVRFATHGSALKVRNLSPWVSNELLELAFSMFGEVERAVVVVDERGKPTGDGVVEFARKPGAQMAMKRCNDGAFLLTSAPRPVIVEPLEQKDEEDGYPEKVLPRNSNQYLKERDIGPRFALHSSFEYEFAQKWKQLFELEKQKRENLEKEIANDRERLDDSMEFALYEHETNILREKLRQREQDANNLLREREMRRRDLIRDDDRHEMMRQDEFMRNDDMRRRQEDSLLMQANHLSSLLDQQEAAIRQMSGGGNVGGGGGGPTGGNSAPGGRGGPAGPMGGGAGGPAGPVMNQGGAPGPGGMPGGQLPRQSRFEQSAGGPPPPMMGQGGPNGPMNRGGMGPMGPQMGVPMGDMRGGGNGGGVGGGMGRREMMDRRDHRDDFAEAKRRRF